jgi:hypothetical protein
VLLTVYFWFMLVYVVVALVITPFAQKKLPSTSKFTRGAWLEQGASYFLLALGLLGVYGYVNAVPILAPTFWKVFLLCLVTFSALQHRMPKTKLLRDTHGPRAVVVATIVGVVMLLPMVYAVGAYAHGSHAVWTQA